MSHNILVATSEHLTGLIMKIVASENVIQVVHRMKCHVAGLCILVKRKMQIRRKLRRNT